VAHAPESPRVFASALRTACYLARVDLEGHSAGEAESSRDGGEPTRQVKRAAPSVPPPSLGSVPPSTSPPSTSDLPLSREALRNEEMGRARVTAQVLIAISTLALVLTPLTEGDPFAKRVFVAGLLWTAVPLIAILRIARDAQRYSSNVVGAASLALALSSTAAVYYIGAFSPAGMVGALGLYIFCLGGSPRWSAALYAALAGPHWLLAMGIVWGVVDDRGIVRGDELTQLNRIAVQCLVQAVYAVAYVAGRAARSQLEGVVGGLESAARRIAQRDALLYEAKRELERAVWAGGEGRFTGQIIGSFRLGTVIGRGGMGEVYEAAHLETQQEAAVKLLHRNVFADPETIARFAREAQAAAALDSPYVVRVLEIPEEGTPLPYIAMERLRGEDLASMLRRERKLSSRELVRLAQQVGSAVDAARTACVVHRDIKPQNLFFSRRDEASPQWKVLDFGVSKLIGQGSLTRDQLVGTPEYMAPEQAAGHAVDHRADIYGLAAVLYRCVASRAPFVQDSLPVLVHKVVHEMPPRPSRFARLAPDIEAFLAVGMAKRPEDRYQSGKELAEAFEAATRGELQAVWRERAAIVLARSPWIE
jgi:hypothetical protein